jgi:hypothetical protein
MIAGEKYFVKGILSVSCVDPIVGSKFKRCEGTHRLHCGGCNALGVGSSAGRSGFVRVKLDDHFTKLLSDQQRRGECHKRSAFGRPGFRVAGVPVKAAEFDVRPGSHRAADPIEGGHHGGVVALPGMA